jgi:hypothetical protein
MYVVLPVFIFLYDLYSIRNQSQQLSYNIEIRTWDGYICIGFVFKKVINPQNKYFVIDFEHPDLISTTY